MKKKWSCHYCLKRFPKEELTPLYEKDKDFVLLYCPKCLSDVYHNILQLPWYHVYSWGQKGKF